MRFQLRPTKGWRAFLGLPEKKIADSQQSPCAEPPANPNKVPSPTRTFEAFFKHLITIGFTPDICIDVGAARGTHSIYEAFPDAYHIAFEPLPDFQDELQKSLAPYAHKIYDCALMDVAGEETILKHQDLFGSSLMHNHAENESTDLLPIRVSTLDIELKKCTLSKLTLLKVDCQGADLSVLKGAKESLKSIDVVIVEASFFKFWGNHQPDFTEILLFMKERGFIIYDLLDGLFRPYDNALGQIDIVFVCEKSFLRKYPYW